MTVTYILILFNLAISYQGFKNMSFFNQYKFNVDGILIHKQWYRIITSGFLHGSWLHFGMNMLTLYFFGDVLIESFGVANFLVIYFGSMVFGSLLSLFVHRNHGDYSAIGASGAVSGAVLSFVVLYPSQLLYLFGLLPLPAWLFAVGYILWSIWGVKSRSGNIGHDAHLGGAAAGTILAVIVKPEIFVQNYWIVLLILIPVISFLLILIYKPEYMLIDDYFSKKARKHLKVVHKEKPNNQEELNKLLDKINQNGYDSLTVGEKIRLKQLSELG